MDETTFANATVNEDNACFENNLPSGVQNVTFCKAIDGMGAPIYISFPHFYSADPFYIHQFTSDSDFAPNQENHEPNMILETTLTVPIAINFRLQLIVRVDPDEDLEYV